MFAALVNVVATRTWWQRWLDPWTWNQRINDVSKTQRVAIAAWVDSIRETRTRGHLEASQNEFMQWNWIQLSCGSAGEIEESGSRINRKEV